MSGDLEDFLRRAAERRQAKAAQQQQPSAPAKRPPPQYSDRRRERVTQVQDADEILTAEIVTEPSPQDPDSFSSRRKRIEEAKQVAAQVQAEVAQKGSKTAASNDPALVMSGNMAEDLVRMLRQPGGIQKAILLREVLDRPEHRW